MSRLPKFEVAGAKLNTSADTEVIGVFQDSGKKPAPTKGAYGALIDKLRKDDVFTGRNGSIEFIRYAGDNGGNVLLVGLGAPAELTEERVRSAAGHVWSRLKTQRSKSAVIHADSLTQRGVPAGVTPVRLARAFAEGLAMSAYQWDKYRAKAADAKDEKYTGPDRLTFTSSQRQKLDREIARVQAIGEAVTVTRDWSNEPSNIGTPEFYANEAKRLAKQYGLKCRVISEAEAVKEKMNLFVGVGLGSERESQCVILEYNPKKASKKTKTIALVGKGVTFDSGGISIKPSLRMEDMKHDMTGAATMMGATILASLWQVPNRIVTVMVFTENMPSGTAIQPGNVITGRNGKTVEIINTDAEGRLILADALDLAQDFKPNVLIDAATLTGAVSVALGAYCAGILGNDDKLINAIKEAGELNGERMWQLPLWDDYFDDLRSDSADMKNSANDGKGGTIRGAIFLKQFVRKGMPWAHLDIASTASGVSHLSYTPKKLATGLYVRTLAQFAADF